MDSLKFWGKTNPYKTLIHHMIDTGCIAKALLEGLMNPVYITLKSFFNELNTDDKILNSIIFYVSLHDLGKCHTCFQNKNKNLDFVNELIKRGLLSPEENKHYRHEYGTKSALSRILKKINFDEDSEDVINMLCNILRLHHQRRDQIDTNKQKIEQLYNKGDYWINEQREIFDKLSILFNADINLLKECLNCDGAAVLLWGLTILSDWLSSGQKEMQTIDENLPLEDYYKKSEEMAKKVIENVGLKNSKTLPKTSFCGLWKNFDENSLRPLQHSCEELVKTFENNTKSPGLIILEAPMGEGKTEAAIFLASHLIKIFNKNGLYVAMPTSATSNQMYERISKLLVDHNLNQAKLIHSTSWLIEGKSENYNGDKEDENVQNSWLAPSRRALLSQFGIGTVDQIMMSILKIKYTSIRLVGIESKVIIMDEVHAYDTYMYTIIERFINWCSNLNIPVILLSATLPSLKKRSLIKAYGGKITEKINEAYPLITTVTPNEECKQIEVDGTFMKSKVRISMLPYMGKWDKLSDISLLRVKNGGCLCVLLNTVNETQEFYKVLKKRCENEDIELILFHARFPAEERQFIENKCKDYFGKNSLLPENDKDYKPRPKKAILVASQVVEQSLDLDFDGMIIALAPIDLLFQRIGREHRHIGRIRPDYFIEAKVDILVSEIPIDKTPTAYVYEPWILNKTKDILLDKEYIELPKDIRSMVENVYNAKPEIDDELYNQWIELTTKEEIYSATAKEFIFGAPNKDYFFVEDEREHFYDEGDNDLNKNSKTRIGSLSIKIAIIPIDVVKKYDSNKPSKEFAELVLKITVSIRVDSIEKIKNYLGFEEPIEGEGLLKGIWILPSNEKKYSWIYGKKIETIIEDKELGIIKKEGI